VTCGDALKAMERLFSVEIDVDDVACFIIEPVQGEGGFLALGRWSLPRPCDASATSTTSC
jgi:4-aminobutyrate aminotransferase / (S)-3-amino-2-methylpropionate transaminase / 5-aminovalerate transaminase